MANDLEKRRAEQPRSEPEILPPGADDPRDPRGRAWSREEFEAAGFRRIEIRQVSGWHLLAFAAAGLAILLLVLVLFASALLIVAPVAAALFVVSYVVMRVRRALRG